MQVPEILPAVARYAFARDRRHWDAQTAALEPDGDGNLALVRIPGPLDGVAVSLPPPYSLGASGIVAGPCGIVFVSDTLHHRVVVIDRRCGTRALVPASGIAGSLPGQFNTPRGLAVGDGLSVADSGNARIQSRAFPELEPNLALQSASAGALQQPTGVAFDSLGRLYVLDETLARIFRFDPGGWPDPVFDLAIAGTGALTAPVFLAIAHGDQLLVSDKTSNSVAVFDASGAFSHRLPAPSAAPWQPGAIAASGKRVFVHDGSTGLILVFSDLHTYCCPVAGWLGPVTALAVDEKGDLLIKPGLDDTWIVFGATAAHASEGTIVFGPLDAGKHLEWFRAAVEVDTPSRTRALLEVAQFDAPAPPPSTGDWVPAPSHDTLLATLVNPGPAMARRWLWLRVTLTTTDPRVSPLLRQVRAETPGENYLDYLPEIYRRADIPDHELSRLLALVRTEQALVDERVDAMPQVISAEFARASTLPWLAEWVALDLPAAAPEDERRALIAGAIAMHERRGTPASIAAFVELYTGIRPQIIEAFAQRGIWVLGESSRLGFDTALPAMDPDGLVVADTQVNAGPPRTCCPPPTGHAVVGETGPLPADRFGEPLFADVAYRFDVLVPAHRVRNGGMLTAIRRVIDREKPAHTQYCLCVVESQVSVGFQARVGIDTILGGPPAGLRLDEARLDLAPLGGRAFSDAARIGMNASVGETTRLS